LEKMSSIVLAGGKSVRLKYNKLYETIGNLPLLQRVVSVLDSFHSDIIIVINNKKFFTPLFDQPRLRFVTDIYPDSGVLGGLYTGLITSNSFYNFVVASDMPFLNKDLLRYMMQCAAGFDVVVPRRGTMLEPLHAIYSKNCIAPIKELLRRNEMRIRNFFPEVRVRYVEECEISQIDPKGLSFFNINTEADLAKARELAEREKGDKK
jgi:molybdopterin-guanine dinucleotide biosynthesis protein A